MYTVSYIIRMQLLKRKPVNPRAPPLSLSLQPAMTEEPLFDPSLKKKKKKKAVAFEVDPLGADADPTTPAPIEDDPSAPTVHEQMKQSALANGDGEGDAVAEDDAEAEAKELFGDLKKKKKKKIPMEFVCCFLASFSKIAVVIHLYLRLIVCYAILCYVRVRMALEHLRLSRAPSHQAISISPISKRRKRRKRSQ